MKTHFWIDVLLNVQGCMIQLKLLVCDTQAQTGILLSKMALEQLQTWQDYSNNTLYVKQTAIPLHAIQNIEFSIREEIGTCPYFEVKLKLRDDKPFFVRPYNIREDQKPIIQKEMDRLEKLGIIRKRLNRIQFPSSPSKAKTTKFISGCH